MAEKPRFVTGLSELKSNLSRRINQLIVDRFHRLWYDAPGTWRKNTYLGIRIKQLPFDLWLYQELLCREKPSFVLQTGVAFGGSILYFSHILDQMEADPAIKVIGIDTKLTAEAKSFNHPRVILIEGNSTDSKTIEEVKNILPAPTGFVSLDSDHSYSNVLRELDIYNQFVGIGGHLVVEDTNINGHPVKPDFGPGPFEAVKEFLSNNPNFIRDDEVWERNLFSFHQYGWLLREA